MKLRDCQLIKPLTCKEEDSVMQASIILRDNKQRRVIVVDQNNFPVGIISLTDINNRLVAQDLDSSDTKAKQIMTSPVALVCDIEENVGDVFTKMSKHKSYFVPVTENKLLFGIARYVEIKKSIAELVKNSTN